MVKPRTICSGVFERTTVGIAAKPQSANLRTGKDLASKLRGRFKNVVGYRCERMLTFCNISSSVVTLVVAVLSSFPIRLPRRIRRSRRRQVKRRQ